MFRLISTHALIQRLQKMRPLAAMTTVITILLGGLLMLPLILLFILVGFIGITLLSRQYMKPYRSAPFSPLLSPSPSKDRYHTHPNIKQEKMMTECRISRTINN